MIPQGPTLAAVDGDIDALRSRERASAPISDGVIAVSAFSATIAALLFWGWRNKHSQVLEPAHGLGYALGIVGSLTMLALLLYPMRKRMRFMRNWGRVAVWFRWHMALGIVGPALVILHSSFTLHSTNATVAFWAMMVVAASGLVGRYLYGQVHKGLYGQKAEAREFLAEAAAIRDMLEIAPNGPAVNWSDSFKEFERAALASSTSLFGAVGAAMTSDSHARRLKKALMRDVDEALRQTTAPSALTEQGRRKRREKARAVLDRYFRAVGRAAHLAVFDRLLSLWHVLHLPLFFVLILTASIHVVAVHLY